MSELSKTVDDCLMKASRDPKNWNTAFKKALAERGLVITEDRKSFPEDAEFLFAPYPVPGDHGWYRDATYIYRKNENAAA